MGYEHNGFNLYFENLKPRWNMILKSRAPKEIIFNSFDKITTDADKCLFETVGDKRIYTVIDKNGNRYVFRENGIMNYKVNFYLNDEESES